MATSPPSAPPPGSATPADSTFRRYTAAQASSYLRGRPGYPDALIETILTHHLSTGGQLTTLLDVGCGPSTATHSFAPHFTRAFGVDPSVAMIAVARARHSTTGTGTADDVVPATPIHFAISAAEDLPGAELASALPPGSVDLLTAATAAHWFDMARFWPRASSLVRPGGTVALWTGGRFYCHPHTTPNAKAVQRVLDRLEHERLGPYKTRGNELAMGLYRELGMPWEAGVLDGEFPEAEFVRKEWNIGGEVEVGETFFVGREVVGLEDFAKMCATASMVTRWRAAHPELVGTEDDVVSLTVRELQEALGGQEWFEGGIAIGLLLFKRR
jgi:trans-aconitate 3-methyltransferase